METLTQALQACWAVRETYFAPVIRFSYPNHTKPVSVTGRVCELQCAHCGGHYLQHMLTLDEAESNTDATVSSFLVSGGCTAEGKVPVQAQAERLAALKRGRKYNFHVGLLDEGEVEVIALLADRVSFDFVGDDATAREVFGLDKTVEDYAQCYGRLKQRCIVAPHVCIGLHGGEIKGEYNAIDRLKALGADSVTFIVFVPTPGTRFAHCQPPDVEEAAAVLAYARRTLGDVTIQLGCMRPGGAYRRQLDLLAVKAGVNGIVNPTAEAVALAKMLGLAVERQEECCVL